MFGSVEHELEMGVPVGDTWDLYSTVRLGELLEKEMPDLIQKVELVEGEGGLESIFITAKTPITGISYMKEVVTKMDDESRTKEKELIEEGFLELGYTSFRIRFQVMEKGEESSIIKTIFEYELNEDEGNAYLMSYANQDAAKVAQFAKIHLNKNEKLANQAN